MGTLWQGLLNSPWLLAGHSEIPFASLSTCCAWGRDGPIPSTPLAYPSGSTESTALSQNPPQFLATLAAWTVPRNEVERARKWGECQGVESHPRISKWVPLRLTMHANLPGSLSARLPGPFWSWRAKVGQRICISHGLQGGVSAEASQCTLWGRTTLYETRMRLAGER